MGEPDNVADERERRGVFGFAPFRRSSRDDRPYRASGRDAAAEGVVGVFDDRLVVGNS